MKNQIVYVPPAEGSKEVFTEEAIAACSTADGHFFVPPHGMEEHTQPAGAKANAQAASPSQRAVENITSVVTRRLAGDLDAEQAQQTLEALNGTRRED